MRKSITFSSTCNTAVMMRGPPGAPRTIKGLPSRTTMVGVMAESGRLPGWIALASPCTSPKHVRAIRLGGKVIHFVIEEEAQTGNGDAAAVAVVERIRNGDRVARGVDDRVVRGFRAFPAGRFSGIESIAGSGVIGIDRRAPLANVSGIEQTVHRQFHKIGIAQILAAIGKKAAHDFGGVVDRRRRTGPGFPVTAVFEHPQHLQNPNATGTGERSGEYR